MSNGEGYKDSTADLVARDGDGMRKNNKKRTLTCSELKRLLELLNDNGYKAVGRYKSNELVATHENKLIEHSPDELEIDMYDCLFFAVCVPAGAVITIKQLFCSLEYYYPGMVTRGE